MIGRLLNPAIDELETFISPKEASAQSMLLVIQITAVAHSIDWGSYSSVNQVISTTEHMINLILQYTISMFYAGGELKLHVLR